LFCVTGYLKNVFNLTLENKTKVKVVELKLQQYGEEMKAENESKLKENLGYWSYPLLNR
jgi:hypothetical protein